MNTPLSEFVRCVENAEAALNRANIAEDAFHLEDATYDVALAQVHATMAMAAAAHEQVEVLNRIAAALETADTLTGYDIYRPA
jgi:hypothetical protein